MVGENRMRHAMEFEYIVHQILSHCGCGERVLQSIEMSIFGKMIYYNDDDCINV
jgi:hypothetical protein